jgi:hypothetical protein
VNAMAVCDNRVVIAASAYGDPRKDKAVAAALSGEAGKHRLRIIDLASGQVVQEIALPAPAVDHGIAIAGDGIAVSCLDGSLLRLAP